MMPQGGVCVPTTYIGGWGHIGKEGERESGKEITVGSALLSSVSNWHQEYLGVSLSFQIDGLNQLKLNDSLLFKDFEVMFRCIPI